MNSTIELLKNHTSIRKFNEVPITQEEEELILSCAMQGATAGNMMLYHIIVVRDKKILETLGESCDHQSFIGQAQMGFLFVVDNHKWAKFFETRGVTDHGQPYTGPELPDLILGMQDAMIAAQNAVVAAESMAIGTCYIGDILENAEQHNDLFELPEGTMPATLVVMGRYDVKPKVRSRFGKEYIVTENKYPVVDAGFIDGMFGETEGLREGFAQKFYSRKVEADFYKEMIRSIKVHIGQWLGNN